MKYMAALHQFKAELFKALGHPMRLRILELLTDGQKTVSELQQALAIEASSVSQQLSVMRARQLVDARKKGTNVFYTLRDPLLGDLLGIARTIFEHQIAQMTSLLDSDAEL